MLVDAGLAGASLAILWLFGLPFTRLLARPEGGAAEMRCWHAAPFIGAAVIILPAQTLFYLGLPLVRSAIFLWALAILSWIVAAFTRQLPNWRNVEWSLFLVLIAVYLAQGLGLFMLGSDLYVGSAWHDEFNYVSTAELIRDYPYATEQSDIAEHPYLMLGIAKKEERIGQAVLHAFIAISLKISTKSSFEFVALLSPALIAVAISWLCRELGFPRGRALLTASVAGLMPAITIMHVECFLSQSLGTPFLLVLPALLTTINRRQGLGWPAIGGLILAAGWSIYTEFVPLFLGAILMFVATEANRRLWWPELSSVSSLTWVIAATLMMLTLAIALNPLYFTRLIALLRSRAVVGDALNGIYPWAGSVEGLARLWLGSFGAISAPVAGAAVRAIGLFFTLLGISGLLAIAAITQRGPVMAAAALSVVPWAMFVFFGRSNTYQQYKVLSSVSPLLPVGLSCIALIVEGGRFSAWKRSTEKFMHFIVVAASCLTFFGTINITFRAGGGAGLTEEAMGRGGQFRLVEPSMRQMQRELEGRAGQTIYISWFEDFFDGSFVNAWLAYFARRNTVFLVNPLLNDGNLTNTVGFDPVIRDPISSFVVVASSRYAGLDQYLRLDNNRFRLYEIPLEAWPSVRQEFAAEAHEPNRWTNGPRP
jgi:hypothetical protein